MLTVLISLRKFIVLSHVHTEEHRTYNSLRKVLRMSILLAPGYITRSHVVNSYGTNYTTFSHALYGALSHVMLHKNRHLYHKQYTFCLFSHFVHFHMITIFQSHDITFLISVVTKSRHSGFGSFLTESFLCT